MGSVESALLDRLGVRTHPPVRLQDKDAIWPDVAAVGGQAWIVWTQADGRGERIRMRRFGASSPEAAVDLSEIRAVACQPAVTIGPDGRVHVVWLESERGAWRLMGAEMDGDASPTMSETWHHTSPLGRPRVVVDEAGVMRTAVEVREKDRTVVAVVEGTTAANRRVKVLSSTTSGQRPTMATGMGGVWVGFDTYDGNAHRVMIERVDAPAAPIIVANDGFQNLQATLAADSDGGFWVSWASNRDVVQHDPWWPTKWFRLARVDPGGHVQTVEDPAGRNLHRLDSFQGFEFPTVIRDRSGSVWVFGQSAHVPYVQRLTADGWSSFVEIAEPHWGSWKPQLRVAGDGPLHVVGMGLQGAEYRRYDLPSSAEPATGPFAMRSPPPPHPTVAARSPRERPQIVGDDGSTYGVFFGDLHAHTILGDATGEPDEIYRRYRDGYDYDFACLTEHDYLDGLQLAPSELATLWAAADQATVEGHFVAFRGYEWTSPAIAEHADAGTAVGEGHRHVIFPDQGDAIVRYGDGAKTGAALLAGLHGVEALVIPHHTGWSGTDWGAHDDRLQRLVEVCSAHGRFEYAGNQPIGHRRDHVWTDRFVLNALAQGHRLGFVGGSDSHGLLWHGTEPEGRTGHVPPGTRVGWKEDAYRAGMTGIIATALTRASLYEALKARRCFATSGVPILLDVRMDGAFMGSEVTRSSAPRLAVRVRGTTPLRSVEVVRNGHVWSAMRWDHGVSPLAVSFDIEDATVTPGENPYYYVRVLQDDGNMAWSSPIWVWVVHA